MVALPPCPTTPLVGIQLETQGVQWCTSTSVSTLQQCQVRGQDKTNRVDTFPLGTVWWGGLGKTSSVTAALTHELCVIGHHIVKLLHWRRQCFTHVLLLLMVMQHTDAMLNYLAV